MLGAVDVGAELDTLLAHLAYAREGEYLEAAAIGEHGAVEAVELMQAASLLYHLQAGAQVEVVGVAEDDLCLDVVLQLGEVHALDGTEGAYGHEYGGLDLSVVGSDESGTGTRLGVGMLELECKHVFFNDE